ncbi:zinc finger protein Gfi-1b-like [Aricia agestis]|uniref:zinc finger protein Gfi-1b-like n=1 Tax=Aricia agestis TaxID=91739 RepID=UPI001C2043C6|nr:zinc finger protein Gfi-1b-like [Aricia agestis]
MASSPPNPREDAEGGSEFTEGTSSQNTAASQKIFIAPSAEQIPTKLEFVARGGTGRSIKHTFRTVKVARRVPTLPPKKIEGASGGASGSGAPSQPSPDRRTIRPRYKRHICNVCDKRFSSPGKLSQHILSHTGELPFSCDLCEKRFNSKFKLVRHSLIHSESRAFACKVCGRTFNRKDHLTNHERVHNPVKIHYTCDWPGCRKSYTSLLSYRKHAALHSAEEGNLQCKICDQTFTSQQDIVYHLKVHTGSRTVKSECDKKFVCDHCERRFFTAKDVRRHSVVHTGRRDFLCPHCPQKFGRKDHLVRHVKNAHPDESWRSAAVGTSKDPPIETTMKESYAQYTVETTDFEIWKSLPKEVSQESQTGVPASDIAVEVPCIDIKVDPLIKTEDPLEIKLEQPTSPSSEILELFLVSPEYTQTPTDLPYITTQPLSDQLDLLTRDSVDSLLIDPGEGTSGLSSQMLGILNESEQTFVSEESHGQQRLPAFTQAFQTAQSPKPPLPPPPPH